jgi:hypothetical protein
MTLNECIRKIKREGEKQRGEKNQIMLNMLIAVAGGEEVRQAGRRP